MAKKIKKAKLLKRPSLAAYARKKLQDSGLMEKE